MKTMQRAMLLFGIKLVWMSTAAMAQPTIYIVRHAEAVETWPADSLADSKPLSVEGLARSQKLAAQFKAKSLAAIYTSHTTRAGQTAQPLAQKLGLSIKFTDACVDTSLATIDAFFKELERNYGDSDSVLLVTHSNIIPQMLVAAGLPTKCYKRMGFARTPHYEGWLIEGYDTIWKIQWGNRNKDCKGLDQRKY